MASAGMGDVLSGIAGAFIAQGLTCRASLCASVCVHGEAADQAAEDLGQVGLKASDLSSYIRRLLNF
jgi:NAD(P)H-hydrate epimerase